MEETDMMTNRSENSCRINTWLGLVLVGIFGALISGCASTALETKAHGSYEVGKQATAKIGTPMLIREEGTIEKKRRWVGLLNSPNGWETIGTKYSDDFKREELIYQGSSGSTINVTYRVFRAGSAMPEQQESLTFDLSESNTILVKGFRLKVLKADGDSINYIIIND
jgi:hypothetical protein